MKDFIPHNEALELKQLGFDEPCLAKYAIYNPKDSIALFPQSQDFFKGYFNYYKNSDYTDKTAAPTFSQAFRWFRDKYKLVGLIEIGTQEYSFIIFNEVTDSRKITSSMNGTYEEAELACLKNLIEIVKEKHNIEK